MNYADLDPKPTFATKLTGRPNLLHIADSIAEELGRPLVPFQRYVIAVATELDENNQFVYREVIVLISRQQGKSYLTLILILLRALMEKDQNIVYGAQSYISAKQKVFEDHMKMIRDTRFADLFEAHGTSGAERWDFINGSRLGLVASNSKSGRGGSYDLAIVDEAFAYIDAKLERSLKPAMKARYKLPHRGAQFWILSNAGATDGSSAWLEEKVKIGRDAVKNGMTETIAYFEWSAPEELDADDREGWRLSSPAIGHLMDMDTMEQDFKTMGLYSFERENLNRWVMAVNEPVFPLVHWNTLEDHNFRIIDKPFHVAFDISPDRSHTAIAAAGKVGNGYGIEIIDYLEGTDELLERLERLRNTYTVSGVLYDSGGPADSFTEALKSRATRISMGEHARACGNFYDLGIESRLHHGGEPILTEAFIGAVRRRKGDSWLWGRTDSAVDICPLVACTIALWGAAQFSHSPMVFPPLQQPEPPKPAPFSSWFTPLVG